MVAFGITTQSESVGTPIGLQLEAVCQSVLVVPVQVFNWDGIIFTDVADDIQPEALSTVKEYVSGLALTSPVPDILRTAGVKV